MSPRANVPTPKFQSTLSVRRATAYAADVFVVIPKFQSTLSVRRATALSMIYNIIEVISIHALREESDSIPALHFSSFQRFQSTLSVRRATVCKIFVRSFIIHFNPRSPWGERLCNKLLCLSLEHFNPRSPWGERLYGCNRPFHKLIISIHALREESDYGQKYKDYFGNISIHALREESDPFR